MPRRSHGPCAGQVPLDDMPDAENQPRGIDTLWLSAVETEVARLAASGRTFSAYDVAKVVGEPSRPHHWGVAFMVLRARQLIEPVEAAPSRRPTVHRSLAWTWRGATSPEDG
jgi:hypothetical protein